MLFAKRLHDGIRRGEISCTVRIWTHLRVKVGAHILWPYYLGVYLR